MSWQKERIDMNVYTQGEVDRWVYSTCNLCSVGCGCEIAVKDEKIVGIRGNGKHSINRGRLGPKGENQWQANSSPDRLLSPLIRNELGELTPASWDEAMNLIVSKMKEAIAKKGPNSIAIYSTGQAFLEDYYTIAKVGRAGLGTHLLDANTRLCTSTTEFCLLQSFGADGAPASYEDIDATDTLMLFGHNVAETGTVLHERIMDRKARTGKPYIIAVDPRKTLTARGSDLHLQLRPGTNVPLLNGLLYLMLQNGAADREFIEKYTIGFEEMRGALEEWTPERTSEATGIPVETLLEAGRILSETPSLVSTTLQGAFQSADATTACVAINNIHLVRGLIGRPGSGPLHMAGQPSSSSNRTVGGVGTYPANRNPMNPQHLEEMGRLWNVDPAKLPAGPEKGIEEQLEMIEQEQIDVFWNIGTNPLVSLPNRKRAKSALEKVFVIMQDHFLTETSKVADIVLPAAMWGEKEGTMENADRRINLLRKAVNPPEGVRTDLDILIDFSKRMDFRDKDGNPLIGYSTPEEAFEEWKEVSRGRPSDMTGMTYEKLERHNGLRWPATAERPEGTVRLYEDFKFPTSAEYAQSYTKDQFTGRALTKAEYEEKQADGRAILHATRYNPPSEQPGGDFPMWLTTGRLVWHWHTRTKTGRSPYLQAAAPHGYVELHEDDAREHGIVEGEVVRVVSPRGWIEVPAKIGDAVQRGLLFVPFHFGSWESNQAANDLTADFVDPLSKQPTFKQSACRIEKLRRQHLVASGETIGYIAGQYKMSVDDLLKVNRLDTPYGIQSGQHLEVPISVMNVPIQPYTPQRTEFAKTPVEEGGGQ
ncbi:molybdopterin-dependent oxidoreductase [Saccharibacillus sp. CPCC 101409]|uniref:molybdopterin-dependent oxidoreductase n=1 Tax=Saccharibacillus sp. CPCC 101409 TaxID=3058041 RepID=UPI00267283EC|nr:molybdopterin-dependent oxidoreductase [Saccharibacillus sp. CPCC 101409]MDO3413267.1 molybdopterin-dependent oxidoreductase [Saccharibacillus sp. CPCC 101409]